MAKMTAELAWQEAQALDQQPPGDVSHIPGQNGLPIIGDALKFFNDPIAYNRSCIEKYGPVFRNRIGPHPSVNLIHPDAQKMLTLDPDQLFSADKGYTPTLGEFFPDGLLLRDFSDTVCTAVSCNRHLKTRCLKPIWKISIALCANT